MRQVGPEIALDQRQRQVDAGGDASGGPVLAAFDEDAVVLHAQGRVVRLQAGGRTPVRGDGPAVEQAGGGQHEGAGTHATGAPGVRVAAAQPGLRFAVDAGQIRAGPARHQHCVDRHVGVIREGAVHLHAQALFPGGDHGRGGDGLQLVELAPGLFVRRAESLPGPGQVQRLESVVQDEQDAQWRIRGRNWRVGPGASAYPGGWRF
ncbi:hypothetical protein D9M68_637820 [compost metagenome]